MIYFGTTIDMKMTQIGHLDFSISELPIKHLRDIRWLSLTFLYLDDLASALNDLEGVKRSVIAANLGNSHLINLII